MPEFAHHFPVLARQIDYRESPVSQGLGYEIHPTGPAVHDIEG